MRLGRIAGWLLLPGLLLAFASGVIAGAKLGWLQPVVKVTVVNQTGGALSGLQLDFRSAGASGELRLPDLENGGRAVARFVVAGGEASYRIQGRRSDGRRLEGRDGYAESGYVITEVLTADGQQTILE